MFFFQNTKPILRVSVRFGDAAKATMNSSVAPLASVGLGLEP